MKTLEQLRADLTTAVKALETFMAKDIVDDDGKDRNMTAEEVTELDVLSSAVEALDKQIDAVEKASRASATKAVSADGGEGKVPAQPKDDKRFKSFGEQLQAIVNAGMNKERQPDSRLIYSKASGANEAVPSEGGFLVQTDFSTELLGLMHDMGQIISRVRKIPLSAGSNGIKLPRIKENSRATGSRFGGIQAYWANEAATVAATKPDFGLIELSLEKLMAIGYATDELLEDAVAMEAIYKQGMAEEITFITENSVYSGSGSGQPLGFMNSGALVTIAAESGQAAGTIVSANILNMTARLPARSMTNSVWLINQDCLPQLWSMTIGSGSATHLMYAPPGLTGDNKNAPWGTLMGRPVVPVEYASTLGTVGDICLVDLSQYLMIDKGGVDASESIHVRFLYDEMTFKITYRVDGQPAWNSPVTPFSGSATQSPYIALATRA